MDAVHRGVVLAGGLFRLDGVRGAAKKVSVLLEVTRRIAVNVLRHSLAIRLKERNEQTN